MAISKAIAQRVVSPLGTVLDRYGVRITRHSFVSWVFARAEGVSYNPPLLLTTRGAITGKKRTVVLPYFQIEEALCVVGSRGGMPSDPYWARNLRADPHSSIRIAGRRRWVRAHFAEGEEREALWTPITDRSPIYLEYQQRAHRHREIPVIVLREA